MYDEDIVEKTLTLDRDWKVGEIEPKERTVALRHIRAMREKGMPKELDAYDIGIAIHVNGRHVQHFGATVGIKKGLPMTREEVITVVARCLLPYFDPKGGTRLPDFTDAEKYVLFGRD